MNMWGWVGEILKSLVGPLFEAFRQWRAERTAQKLGRAEQVVADLKETATVVRKANEGRSRVGGSDTDVDELLKPPAARARGR